MSKIHHLPTAEIAQIEASEWIVRLQNEDATAEEVQQFELWKSAHPLHDRMYQELATTWNGLRRAGQVARAVSFGHAINASGLSGDQLTVAGNKRIKRVGLSIAAVVASVAVATVLWMTRLDNDTRFQTAIGERASIELPDGSKLELNSNSLARVEYTKAARVVRLSRGEAFFSVAHESSRPFWVVADRSWIRAVGTAFNVNLQPSGVSVVVSEGAVKVGTGRVHNEQPSDRALAEYSVSLLSAGQQAEVNGNSADIRAVKPTELRRLTAWREGMLHFDDQSLGSVVAEIGRYTPLEIHIEDPALSQLVIGGMFEANSSGVDALFIMLQDGFGLSVRQAGMQVFIERKSTLRSLR